MKGLQAIQITLSRYVITYYDWMKDLVVDHIIISYHITPPFVSVVPPLPAIPNSSLDRYNKYCGGSRRCSQLVSSSCSLNPTLRIRPQPEFTPLCSLS